MKLNNKKQVPALKVNEGTLKGGFKTLTDLQKNKIKAGFNAVCGNSGGGGNCKGRNGICW
ncbi:hypothetical protein [Apibacter sp. HY039]|uniref:hypothetical protein n=1 Tax=Apibacter sp. HY039 TaxID=2501476 RepID=UPI000FEB8B32|nr:hypothetical protein [Apibacter sp. HY039]